VVRGIDVVGVVRVLSGEFPTYAGILPGEASVEIVVNREQMLSAVRSAAIFARDSANVVQLEIADSLVTVRAQAAQVGESSIEVEAEPKKKGKGAIAFNSKYLLDFLTHTESEQVGLAMTDALKPGLFYEVGNVGFKHVIMPVRVKQ
jgi:DNA polymerase-3 subunit beta